MSVASPNQTPEMAAHALRIRISRRRRVIAGELGDLTDDALGVRLLRAAGDAAGDLPSTRARVERAILDLECPTRAVEA